MGAAEYPANIAGQIPSNFDPTEFMDAKEVKRQGRFTHLAMAASKIAVKDANLDISGKTTDLKRIGCLLGSGISGVEVFENNCKKKEPKYKVTTIENKKRSKAKCHF